MSNIKTIVCGIGNPLLSDDSFGLHVIDHLSQCTHFSHIHFTKNYSAGIDLLYDLESYECAIIVDSVKTGKAAPGTLHEFGLDDIFSYSQTILVDSHGLNLPTVIEMGRQLGYELPKNFRFFGVEGTDFHTFNESPTQEVLKTVPLVSQRIIQYLNQKENHPNSKTKECVWREKI